MLSVDISSGEPGFADELLDKLVAKLRGGERLLIIDDIGMRKLPPNAAEDLLEIVMRG